jgi:hypothetical protein
MGREARRASGAATRRVLHRLVVTEPEIALFRLRTPPEPHIERTFDAPGRRDDLLMIF